MISRPVSFCGAAAAAAQIRPDLPEHDHDRRDRSIPSINPGIDRAHEQVADRDRQLIGHDDQHDRRRNEDAERAGGRDHPGRELFRIILPHHDRDRQCREQHDRRADNAGRCREQDSDQDDGDGQPAAHLAEHADEIRHHQLGDARAIEHQAHIDEHRQRNEHPVRHRGENTVDDDREIAASASAGTCRHRNNREERCRRP